MKVFLTGATGFIGQALTRQLLQRGWEVTAHVRRPDSPQGQNVAALGATVVKGDILDVSSMREPMQGADIVIHNAGAYEYGVTGEKKKRMYAINVDGTENVLGLAHELKIPRTVYISTVQVYGDTGPDPIDEAFEPVAPSPSYYAHTKVLAHDIALKYAEKGLPLMIACPNGVVGPNDHSIMGYFLRMYLNNISTPVAWGPDDVFSLIYVDDLAEGIALVAEKGRIGETYHLSGESMTRRDLLALWATKPGRFAVRFYIPQSLAAILFAPMAPLLRLVGLPAFISYETVNGIKNMNSSSKKAQDELGWTFRSAEQAWLETIDAEIELKKQRTKQSIVAKLIPM